MKKYSYDTNELESIYGLKKGFLKSDVVIIDNEIQNDISDGWIYKNGKLCVVGILFKDKIEILCAEEEDDKNFKEYVKVRLKELSNEKIYAFNKYMEMGNFIGDIGFQIDIEEIKPFNGKGWNKDRFFSVLQDKSIIPNFKVYDPFKGYANLCIDYWNEYINTNDEFHLKQIVLHNINCLIKETIILKNKDYFNENYSTNNNNWLV